jgi:hypothetical protein
MAFCANLDSSDIGPPKQHYRAESGCETGSFCLALLIAARISSLAQPFGHRSTYERFPEIPPRKVNVIEKQ